MTAPALRARKVPTNLAIRAQIRTFLALSQLPMKMEADRCPPKPHIPRPPQRWRAPRRCSSARTIDVSAFLPLDEFTATVAETVDAIKSLPPADEARELTEIAAGLGVNVPAPIG